jgi:hypothetical protein
MVSGQLSGDVRAIVAQLSGLSLQSPASGGILVILFAQLF